MNKLAKVLSLVVVLIMIFSMSCMVCFADTDTTITRDSLNIVKTYPVDGATGTSLENMSIKITFDSELTRAILSSSNDDKITIYGPDGKALKTRILYHPKETGVVLALVEAEKEGDTFTAESAAEYKVVISKDFVDNYGNSLGKDTTITFTTLDQKKNNIFNTVLMFVMFGAIIVISMKAMKPQEKKEEEEKKGPKKDEKVNPYKQSKKTGKSVEEIVNKDQASKSKKAEREAKKAAKEAKKEAKMRSEYMEIGHYEAARRHSASEAGSKYVQAKREKTQARLEQEAKWAQQAKKKAKKK